MFLDTVNSAYQEQTIHRLNDMFRLYFEWMIDTENSLSGPLRVFIIYKQASINRPKVEFEVE